jgi:hypothetical protein
MLDAAEMHDARIVAGGDLDERRSAALVGVRCRQRCSRRQTTETVEGSAR